MSSLKEETTAPAKWVSPTGRGKPGPPPKEVRGRYIGPSLQAHPGCRRRRFTTAPISMIILKKVAKNQAGRVQIPAHPQRRGSGAQCAHLHFNGGSRGSTLRHESAEIFIETQAPAQPSPAPPPRWVRPQVQRKVWWGPTPHHAFPSSPGPGRAGRLRTAGRCRTSSGRTPTRRASCCGT